MNAAPDKKRLEGVAAEKSRMLFVDGLRGIASLMVVAYHLGNRTGLAFLTSRGYLGVGVFFVLSGFVIASVADRGAISIGYIGRFAARRVIRLDIPYWVSIMTAIAFAMLAVRFGGVWPGYSVQQIAAHLVYLQDILGFPAISDTYWTLCFEIQFYLTLLLLLWGGRLLPPWLFRVAFLLTVVFSLLASTGTIGTPRGAMFAYWWAFALGTVTWWTIRGGSLWVFGVAVVIVLSAPLAAHADWRLTAAVTASLLLAASRLGSMGKWLAGPVSQFFGRISYSLYLFHPIIGWSAQSFALRHLNQYVALAVGIAVSIGSAWLAYVVIELPALNLSRRVSLRASRPTPGGAYVASGGP